MTVNIYKTKKGSSRLPFLVECNRLEGDHSVFRRIYGLLSESLSDDGRDSCSTAVTDTANPDLLRHSSTAYDVPVPAIEDVVQTASDASAIAEAIQMLVTMSYDSFQETRLLAARLWYEFTANEMQNGSISTCTSPKILAALIKLATGDCNIHGEDEVRFAALLALSNLCRGSVLEKNALIDAGLVPVIINAIGDGNYLDAHIRRECASMLHNLSSGTLAHKVLSNIGISRVNALCPIIDGLVDERIKLHALMAKESLLSACSPVS